MGCEKQVCATSKKIASKPCLIIMEKDRFICTLKIQLIPYELYWQDNQSNPF